MKMKRMASLLAFIFFAILTTFSLKASAEVISGVALDLRSAQGTVGGETVNRTSSILFPNVLVRNDHGKDDIRFALRACVTDITGPANVVFQVYNDNGDLKRTLTRSVSPNGCATFANFDT